jgi:hypothetical protein
MTPLEVISTASACMLMFMLHVRNLVNVVTVLSSTTLVSQHRLREKDEAVANRDIVIAIMETAVSSSSHDIARLKLELSSEQCKLE